MTKLNAKIIEEILKYCLFKQDENKDNKIIVEGIVHAYGFHPGRISEKKEVIKELLLELPIAFMKNGGGGVSFLEACMDKYNNQWTDEHCAIENLFILGIATGQAQWCFPRDLWNALPGGMPYVMITVE